MKQGGDCDRVTFSEGWPFLCCNRRIVLWVSGGKFLPEIAPTIAETMVKCVSNPNPIVITQVVWDVIKCVGDLLTALLFAVTELAGKFAILLAFVLLVLFSLYLRSLAFDLSVRSTTFITQDLSRVRNELLQ